MTNFENPNVTLKSNWLQVNKHTLRADVLEFPPNSNKLPVSAQALGKVLKIARRAILPHIPEKGAVWTAQLGTTSHADSIPGDIFTKAGHANGGVIMASEEIQDKLHPHWNSAYDGGFMPEVRRISGKADGGAWLLLRRPSIADVLSHWLRYTESEEGRAIRRRIEETRKLADLTAYRSEAEQHIDSLPPPSRSRLKIGLILAMGALKHTLEDLEGYNKETADALEYANNSPDIDEATVFAIENSRNS